MEVESIKKRLRVTSAVADEEIEDLIKSCREEMKIKGIYGPEDALYQQAIVLYCKAHYGYDEKTERFLEAYQSLTDAMALSGEYEE